MPLGENAVDKTGLNMAMSAVETDMAPETLALSIAIVGVCCQKLENAIVKLAISIVKFALCSVTLDKGSDEMAMSIFTVAISKETVAFAKVTPEMSLTTFAMAPTRLALSVDFSEYLAVCSFIFLSSHHYQ